MNCLLTLLLLQAGEHLLVALTDELLLDCIDARQVDASEDGRDDPLEELLTLLKLLDACIIDAALASCVLNLLFIGHNLVGPHAVGDQVDFKVAFVVLGYLDVGFDFLGHGKVIGCDLIEFVKKLTSPPFRQF